LTTPAGRKQAKAAGSKSITISRLTLTIAGGKAAARKKKRR
jgi:hypothetical protein